MRITPFHSPAHRIPFSQIKELVSSGDAPASPDKVSLSPAIAGGETQGAHGGWARTDLLVDDDPHFGQQNFHPRQKHRDPDIIKAFGTDTPDSGKVLLHYAGAPPKGAKKHPYPVLLVHGATKNGNFFWDPHENGTNDGPAQRLRDEGFEVYAVTFAHNQDDNFLWAEQVANAITRIKEETGAEKIDLVGHSKGGMPVRMYASDVHEPWMTPFRHDVHRLVLIGAPNGGIDYSFRHPSANYALYKDSDDPRLNAPMSWNHIVAWGRRRDTSDLGFSKEGPDYWPGQRQMLARWNDRFPLSPIEPDWYTTYNGGTGLMSSSDGIDKFIEEGGNLIERLNNTPISPDVEVAVLAGDKANIPGVLNEYTGPSDGIVFVESVLKLPEGSNVVEREVKHLHHKALVSEPEGQDWLVDVLSRDKFEKPAATTEDLLSASMADFEADKDQVAAPSVLTQF
ncbi:MAG: esterase/lipase family protein [Vulcanimicrobiota bacterium]